MISTCANPACNEPFHYLRGGRLYRFDAPCGHSEDVSNAVCATSSSRCAVFFWLCEECSSRLSLTFNGRETSVMPMKSPFRERARKPIVAIGEWKTSHDEAADVPQVSPLGSTATPVALDTKRG